MALFESLGFKKHPFSKTNADEEPELASYFVPPPYFDAVIGDASLPSPSIVFAPRGAGKTALRRMVESHSIEQQYLAVTYDRFEFSQSDKIENVSLQYHLRNIIIRILLSYLSYLSENLDSIKKLTHDEKSHICLFVKSYLGDITGDKIQELMNELRSIPDKIKSFWSKNVGFMESALNFILKTYDLETIDLPKIQQDEKKLSETYKYQLEILLGLVKKLNFKSIYILIDRVDETEKTGNNPLATYKLIQPLLKDLDLLGLKGFGFKFFLWDKIESLYREDARPDRIAQYKLNWTTKNLQELLSKRILSFSDNAIHSMHQLITPNPTVNVDMSLSIMANSSPRNLIRICEKILAEQSVRDPSSNMISSIALDAGITIFCENFCKEIYGEEKLKEIQKVGVELFTTNYVANNILKITGQGARNKITGWVSTGLVLQIGTIAVPESKKPVNFYCVVDPSAVRLIHRRVEFQKFIQDRWIPCNYCLTDNLIDIALYPDDNEPECRNCGRSLI